MTKYTWMIAGALFVGAAMLVGCEKGGSSDKTPEVGVIDLDQVATETGVNEKYRANLQAYAKDQQAKLSTIINPLQAELAKLQKQVSDIVEAMPKADRDKPLIEQPKELQKLVQAINDKQQLIRSEGQTRETAVQTYDRKMKTDYKEKIQPALAEVAKSKGVKVIIAKGATEWREPTLDLSNELVSYLKAHPVADPPPPPAVSAPNATE